MENYKFCNLILKKQYNINISDYYKIYYVLLSNNINVKLSKNCIIFNNIGMNFKIFVNGILTLTGIKFNSVSKDDISKINYETDAFINSVLNTEINFIDLQDYNDLFLTCQKNIDFLISKTYKFVGLKINSNIILHNIPVQNITVDNQLFYISYNNNNKNKKLFKDGELYGSLFFKMFKSKNFFNNSTVKIDYNTKSIYSNEKIIGTIKINPDNQKIYIPKKIDSTFTIVSCNIQFKLNKAVNRYNLFVNLLTKGYIVEYKLFDNCSVNLFYDNITCSVFKSGNVIIKGISNNSKFDNINNYVSSIYDIILSNS